MKIVKKVILWVPLLCIAAFLVVWLGALLKNYILTVKYADVLENMVITGEEFLPEYDFERILSYSETEIKTYFMKKTSGDYSIGGMVTYKQRPDGTWSYSDNVTWSHGGTAEDYIWPYWHHFFIH